MFFLRRIGYLLRGNATPFQIISGCLLGTMLGFMPDIIHAPGLTAVLVLMLVVLNANLVLAALVGLAAKLLSLALLPVSFAVGRFLLDGPTEGIFKALINAPVFALFGFESYVATGGLLVGGLLGLVTGIIISRSIHAFRRKMAELGQNSPRYQAFMAKGWARFTVFVFAGGGLKDPDYAALLKPKIGNPIRPLGAVLVVLVLVLGVTLQQFFSSTIITTALRSGLERANGATVELESADLDLGSGRMVLTGLAAADPNNLGTDLFRATHIEADVSGVNLLRKRLQLDRVVVTEATSGEQRRVPGRRTASAAEPSRPIQWPDAGSIEDYLRNAQVWRERLAQLQRWLDKISGPPATETDDETLEERLRRQAAAQGYAALKATHLIEGAPTLLITELQANGVKVSQLPDETLNITARNLSTQPGLAPGAPEVVITSTSDRLGFQAAFSGLSAAGGDNVLAFHYRELPVDSIMGDLKVSGGTLLTGGTLDLAATGRYFAAGGEVELPLKATLHNTTLTVAGRVVPVSNFTLPVGLAGSLSNPKIQVDGGALGDLVRRAGTDALRERATEEIQKSLGDKAGGLLKGILPGKK